MASSKSRFILCSPGKFSRSAPQSLWLRPEEVASGVFLLSQWAAGEHQLWRSGLRQVTYFISSICFTVVCVLMFWRGRTEVCVSVSAWWTTRWCQCRRPAETGQISSVSSRKSWATARKSKTRCSHGNTHLPVLHLSYSRMTCCCIDLSLVASIAQNREVLVCVSLCCSDCESGEVLTLLCQGKIQARICPHSLWHTGTLYTLCVALCLLRLRQA